MLLSPWMWKGVSATSPSGRYTLSYPRGWYIRRWYDRENKPYMYKHTDTTRTIIIRKEPHNKPVVLPEQTTIVTWLTNLRTSAGSGVTGGSAAAPYATCTAAISVRTKIDACHIDLMAYNIILCNLFYQPVCNLLKGTHLIFTSKEFSFFCTTCTPENTRYLVNVGLILGQRRRPNVSCRLCWDRLTFLTLESVYLAFKWSRETGHLSCLLRLFESLFFSTDISWKKSSRQASIQSSRAWW